MNKLALLTVALALAFSAPAFAHDLAAMGDMDGDLRPTRWACRWARARTW